MPANLYALIYIILSVALAFGFLYCVIRLAVSAGVQDAVKKLKDQNKL